MSVPLLEQAIGAWFADVARQDQYHRALIVAFGQLVVIATFNSDAIQLVYDGTLLTKVILKPQFIDFADKAFGQLKIKELPKSYEWSLIPPTEEEKKSLSPRRIMMINPDGIVPADKLPQAV